MPLSGGKDLRNAPPLGFGTMGSDGLAPIIRMSLPLRQPPGRAGALAFLGRDNRHPSARHTTARHWLHRCTLARVLRGHPDQTAPPVHAALSRGALPDPRKGLLHARFTSLMYMRCVTAAFPRSNVSAFQLLPSISDTPRAPGPASGGACCLSGGRPWYPAGPRPALPAHVR